MPADLIRRALAAGVRLELTDEGLAFEAPATPKADEALAALAARREEVLEVLRARQAAGDRIGAAIDQAGHPAPRVWLVAVNEAHQGVDLDRLEVLATRFESWATGRLDGGEPELVVLHSSHLEAEVLVVLDEAVRVGAHLDGMAVYTLAEVRRLSGVPLAVLQAVHTSKAVWPGARVEGGAL